MRSSTLLFEGVCFAVQSEEGHRRLAHQFENRVDRRPAVGIGAVQPMFVHDVISRRPISTKMLARTGSRKRSEMRLKRRRAILQESSPGKQALQTSGLMSRSRMPWRCLPLPQAPHSDHRCIACVLGRHRHTRKGFDRDRRRFPVRTAATPARMSNTHRRLDILRP
jgi:hypothetical protein